MSRWPFAVGSICAGLACLAMVSCQEPAPIKSMFRSKTLFEESHFGFSPRRVSVLVESDDKKLESDLKTCLLSGLRHVSGITLVTSEPLYSVEVLALPRSKNIAVSVVVSEITAPCPGNVVAHHILVGEKDHLKRLCNEVVDSFEKKLVAPFR
jgi:hypothetical protein